jgi:hypothetical protein
MRTCDVCGEPATISDGVVDAELCEREACLHVAWDRAFGPSPKPVAP